MCTCTQKNGKAIYTSLVTGGGMASLPAGSTPNCMVKTDKCMEPGKEARELQKREKCTMIIYLKLATIHSKTTLATCTTTAVINVSKKVATACNSGDLTGQSFHHTNHS